MSVRRDAGWNHVEVCVCVCVCVCVLSNRKSTYAMSVILVVAWVRAGRSLPRLSRHTPCDVKFFE